MTRRGFLAALLVAPFAVPKMQLVSFGLPERIADPEPIGTAQGKYIDMGAVAALLKEHYAPDRVNNLVYQSRPTWANGNGFVWKPIDPKDDPHPYRDLTWMPPVEEWE